MFNKYSPLEDRVLVKPNTPTAQEKTDGGIIIPDTVRKIISEGTVAEVGAGRYAPETGMFIPTVLGKGDTVVYGAEAGVPITIDKIEYKLMRESDILICSPKKTEE